MTPVYPISEHESGWAIPTDWDGETWQCMKLQWPDSDQYRSLLRGLLFTLTRGREYDKGTGTITEAQLVGWQIFDANFTIVPCDACGGETTQEQCAVCGGGLVIQGEDDVGQVVTDVWIDYETNQLVVEFGNCCPKRFAFPVATTAYFDQPDEEMPDEPDYPEGTEEYNNCATATAIWEVWVGCVDIILDAATNLAAPWSVVGLLETAYPGINFGSLSVLNAFTAAISVVTQGYASEVETVSWLKEVKCAFATVGATPGVGWTEDEYSTAQSLLVSVGNKHFTALSFPTAFGPMGFVWFYTFQAIGKGDAKDITTRVVPTGDENCNCGDGVQYEYGDYYLSEELSSEQASAVTTGWTHVGIRYILPEDVYGVIVQFDTYEQRRTKRMNHNDLPGTLDSSLWDDTSDNLQPDINEGKAFVWFADIAIGFGLAAQAGFTSMFFMDAGTLGVKFEDAGDIVGAQFDIADETPTPTIARFYYIYKKDV